MSIEGQITQDLIWLKKYLEFIGSQLVDAPKDNPFKN